MKNTRHSESCTQKIIHRKIRPLNYFVRDRSYLLVFRTEPIRVLDDVLTWCRMMTFRRRSVHNLSKTDGRTALKDRCRCPYGEACYTYRSQAAIHTTVIHIADPPVLLQSLLHMGHDVIYIPCTEILLEASKAIGLEVNPEKTKYMIMSRVQNIVGNGNIKIGDLSFEEVEKFKYLGATVTNINDTREEIKRRINMGNACYYSVEKLLSSSLLFKNLKVRIYKTVILPVLLYGCETWTLNLREEHRLRVFENKVLRKMFGAKRDEVTGEWRKLHNAELHALYSSPDIIRNIKSRRLRWAGHVARMGESSI
ncbi:hypothetical protein ANN_12133 [Periplaneta americana]|uniref:Reverse transcriptase domain-containing protein n=1 Tax=Periplaneta americana TaxID=6978 RepID=A0ABQ8T8T9_PERAM|nr:hypothetical protein ANN_12133 [Periplaneta americana]